MFSLPCQRFSAFVNYEGLSPSHLKTLCHLTWLFLVNVYSYNVVPQKIIFGTLKNPCELLLLFPEMCVVSIISYICNQTLNSWHGICMKNPSKGSSLLDIIWKLLQHYRREILILSWPKWTPIFNHTVSAAVILLGWRSVVVRDKLQGSVFWAHFKSCTM